MKTVKAARFLLKVKGKGGAVGMSPEGYKKAKRIISASGRTEDIMDLIRKSPSRVTEEAIRRILGLDKILKSKSLSVKAMKGPSLGADAREGLK
jgi:hypothetical protein